MPLPLAWPGAVSPTYVYSGWPLYVACVEPSDRLIVASLPVTPLPAVAGPGTGGQNEAHDPLQFDLVEVSGTNQYKVRPLAFVSTATPPMVLVVRAALVEAVPDELPDGADDLAEAAVPAGEEVEHPAARTAAAAKPAAAHRETCLRCPGSAATPLRECL
jgi:hypothetical protein